MYENVTPLSNLTVGILGGICFAAAIIITAIAPLVEDSLSSTFVVGVGVGPCALFGCFFLTELGYRIRFPEADPEYQRRTE